MESVATTFNLSKITAAGISPSIPVAYGSPDQAPPTTSRAESNDKSMEDTTGSRTAVSNETQCLESEALSITNGENGKRDESTSNFHPKAVQKSITSQQPSNEPPESPGVDTSASTDEIQFKSSGISTNVMPASARDKETSCRSTHGKTFVWLNHNTAKTPVAAKLSSTNKSATFNAEPKSSSLQKSSKSMPPAAKNAPSETALKKKKTKKKVSMSLSRIGSGFKRGPSKKKQTSSKPGSSLKTSAIPSQRSLLMKLKWCWFHRKRHLKNHPSAYSPNLDDGSVGKGRIALLLYSHNAEAMTKQVPRPEHRARRLYVPRLVSNHVILQKPFRSSCLNNFDHL